MAQDMHHHGVSYETLTDQQIVQYMIDRDELAFRMLMTRHATRLAAIAQRVLGSSIREEDVEEVVSDAFLKSWQNCVNYDHNRASVATWLGWLTVYEALHKRRKELQFARLQTALQHKAQHDAPLRASQSWQDHVHDRTRVEFALRTLAVSSPRDANLIIRRYINQETPAEMAVEMQINADLVRVQIARALKRLRTIMKQEAEE